MTSLPPFSTLDPGTFYGSPPPKNDFNGNPPFTQISYRSARVLGDKDINWMRPPSPHTPGDHFSTGHAQMYSNENLSLDRRVEEAVRSGRPRQDASDSASGHVGTEQTDTSPSLSKKKGVRRKTREEFSVVELEKLMAAVMDVDPFMCKHGEVDGKWKEVLDVVQEKGYCRDRTVGSIKNKILGEIKRVENKQPINPSSQLGKELLDQQDRMKYLNGRLDMIAGMRKRAADTKEEEREGKRQKDNINKLIGAKMRDSMMKAHANPNKLTPNDDTDSGSDQPHSGQSSGGQSGGEQLGGEQLGGEQSGSEQSGIRSESSTDDIELIAPPRKRARRDDQVKELLEDQNQKQQEFQERFLEQQRSLADKLIEESRLTREMLAQESQKNREVQDGNSKLFIEVMKQALLGGPSNA
ncbi:hypothetical protein M422DRAFT_26666 [Sphaerobolus stellatus SS14]|uniref:Uncharacterized protein n=1 Tax=Sphaerobolus stellatus (strain SS14) TaxID=990650 RepID=A0A0C9UWD9_SPHS4|nr:hypothetical protein M422DRAFT_40021 [Sphaerobolus stellatus SS14]KIJ47988.1 hypothetical protein M422DRAFT_28529 [Sphaerobolus stellatus SS14]KIJ49620.1 hypothetical protein M422DRAFT_27983 [Sphaerobolus stellatus SS14]KIJ51247.1 hypothetical protein M422DRAFT_26666 [Sphaerobolus stellatus SS14]